MTTGSKHDGVGFFPFGLVRGLTHERCEHKKFSAPMLTSFVSDHIVLPPLTHKDIGRIMLCFFECVPVYQNIYVLYVVRDQRSLIGPHCIPP